MIRWAWNNMTLADLKWHADMKGFESYSSEKEMKKAEEKAQQKAKRHVR